MKELTISMPLSNDGCHIRMAIECVLQQSDLEFELVVLDCGSTDDSVSIVQSFCNSKIRLIQVSPDTSVAECHNMVIRQCDTPFFATMTPHVLLNPGALKKFVSFCRHSSHVGMAWSNYFSLKEGRIESREHFYKRQEAFIEIQENHLEWLLINGSIPGNFTIYQSAALKMVGGFNENIRALETYDLSLRIWDQFDAQIVPEYLYCIANHDMQVKVSNEKSVSTWFRRMVHTYRLLKSGKLRTVPNNLYWKAFQQTTLQRRIAKFFTAIRNAIVSFLRNASNFLYHRIYYFLLPHLSWWPIEFFQFRNVKRKTHLKRVAYYTWHFPVLSQTFILRELQSLLNSGLSVHIVADGAEDLESVDSEMRNLLKNTTYIFPTDTCRLREYHKYFFRRNPFKYLNLLIFVLTHSYGRYKKPHMDLELFTKIVYLAGILKDKQIEHVHSPWADIRAFTALVASRLIGISYSVQGRAHDLHRHIHQFAYREKFHNAEFIITNSEYNRTHIERRLWQNCNGKLHTIYEGLDPDQFVPSVAPKEFSTDLRILCVARLIEAKGLMHLLEACKILKEGGYSFRCEIIGAPEGAAYINYFLELMKLHGRLGLHDCVFFLGAKPFSEVLQKYQEADVFVLPSIVAGDGTHDITPNALLEAMAMKLPVIATRISAIPEIVDDGMNGLLVSPGDEKALSEAILKLRNDEQLRKVLGVKARERVEERFNIRKNIAEYVSLFLNGA